MYRSRNTHTHIWIETYWETYMSQQQDMMGDKNKILEVQWKALKTESKDYAGK